jgi:hypothetical protein
MLEKTGEHPPDAGWSRDVEPDLAQIGESEETPFLRIIVAIFGSRWYLSLYIF